MDKGTRADLLDRLVGTIESVTIPHPLRVAVDGPPAAGKTTLADELALLLRSRGREVIRASTEGFQLPRAQRYRHGEFSPEANYHETFDYDTLRRLLLDPLGPGGDRRYQHAVYDLDTDTAMSPPATTAPADAVLLLDGVFLPRPELTGRWDLSIFVSTALDQVLDRARIRDLARLGHIRRQALPRAEPRRQPGPANVAAHIVRHCRHLVLRQLFDQPHAPGTPDTSPGTRSLSPMTPARTAGRCGTAAGSSRPT